MLIVPKAFPPEFRRDVVAVARKGQAPLSQISKDFGVSESCLHRWLNLADVEDGVRPGVTASESCLVSLTGLAGLTDATGFVAAWADAGLRAQMSCGGEPAYVGSGLGDDHRGTCAI